MAHRILRDEKEEGWEESDFPIVCETCLGPNPYVRMQKIPYGGECHISGRPYTVFRWRPGNEARYKKTIICQEVAKAKNVCQVCLFDLQYGLPVEVRDRALAMAGQEVTELAASDVGREYQLKQMERDGTLDNNEESFKAKGSGHDLLLRLARTQPYYQRNRAKICTFYVRGECKRGAECPFRHEMPTDPTNPLANQNIKDRYFGVNDPVAAKMLDRASKFKTIEPPADPTITTLWIGGVEENIGESDLRDVFYGFGEIASIKVISRRNIAFVEYARRSSAEAAVEALANRLIIKGVRLNLNWAKPIARPQQDSGAMPVGASHIPGGPAMPAYPPPGGRPYAAMDPTQMGALPAGTGAKEGGAGEGPGAGQAQYPAYPPMGMGMPPMGMPPPMWGAPPPGFAPQPPSGAPPAAAPAEQGGQGSGQGGDGGVGGSGGQEGANGREEGKAGGGETAVGA